MTSPARIAMVQAYIKRREAYVADQMRLTEALLAAESDVEREALLACWDQIEPPGTIRGGADKWARNKRRRQAAERGARTVLPYAARGVDMSAFEAQFADGAR